jgi:hypothetical protein
MIREQLANPNKTVGARLAVGRLVFAYSDAKTKKPRPVNASRCVSEEMDCPNLILLRSGHVGIWRKAAMSPERRKYRRFRAKARTICASVSGPIPSFRARIVDISQGGVRLLVNPHLNVGDLLRIRLSRVVEGRLVHVALTETGKWVVGCAFKGELSESEVRDWARKSGR